MPNNAVTITFDGKRIAVDDENEHVKRRERLDWILQMDEGDRVVIEFEEKTVDQGDLVDMDPDDDEADVIHNGKLKGPFRKRKNQAENSSRGVYDFTAKKNEERKFKTGRASVHRGFWKSDKWKYTIVWTRGSETKLDPHVSIKR